MMASMFACVSTRQRARRRHPPPGFFRTTFILPPTWYISIYSTRRSTTEDSSEKGNAYGVWKIIIIIIINAFCGIIVTSSFLLYIHV